MGNIRGWVGWIRERLDILGIRISARGGKCSNGGTLPNTAFIFRAFVATPRTLSYLCIFYSFYLALDLNIQVMNSPGYSIAWNLFSKF